MRPADTSPETWKVFVDLQKKLTPTQKLETAFALSDSLWSLARANVELQHPEAQEREIFLRTAARRLDRATMIKVYGFDPADK